MTNKALRRTLTILCILALFTIIVANPFGISHAKESLSGSGTLIIANDILKVAIDDSNETDGIGTFTIATNGSHPNPGQDVFYDGAYEDAWSSFTTIRVEDTFREYVTSSDYKIPSIGYTDHYLDNYDPIVVKESANRASISWTTLENLTVTLLIEIRGASLADTMVEVTVTIQNDDTITHSVAVRHQWDIMIEAEDDSWIRVWTTPNTPQSWTENETDWISPSFQFWETTNNPYTPAFSIYGSTILPYVNPPPTPPDRLVYASWASSDDTAYDFTISGEWDMDSAVLYYWNAVTVAPGEQISRTAYVTTVQTEPTAFAWSSDSLGNPKPTFNVTDDVYITGQDFPTDTNVTIYLIPDGMGAVPINSAGNESSITNGTGYLQATMVWPQPLLLGEYDVWIDVNQNGVFDSGDVWNSQSLGIFATEVIPEFHSIVLLSLMMTILLLVILVKRGKRFI